ncbi:MAG: hypothetical protein WCJ30_25370 [Deltaproteobacteria bacterium]
MGETEITTLPEADALRAENARLQRVNERWAESDKKMLALISERDAENARLRKALEDALEIIRSVNDPTRASAGLRQIVEAALRPDGDVGG